MTGSATPYLLACATLLIALIAGWGWSRRLAPLRDRALLQQLPLAPSPDAFVAAPLAPQSVFERNAAGLLMVDSHGLIVDANPALCELFDYARADLIGQPAALLHRGERPFKPFRGHGEGMSEGRGNLRAEQRFRRRDGGRLWCQIAGSSLELADGVPAMLWTVVDVDALHVAQEQVHHQALHDELTGLPNRRALDQQLPKAIARARRHGSVLALGVIDLDDFKPVNDTWGHEAGDRLLVEVATRLRRRLRESDLIVRSGGDEFVVLIEDLETGFVMQQLSELLQRLHGAVETTVEVAPGQEAKVDASIGLALFPLDVQDADGLQRLADAAMYQAKLQKHTRGVWWHRGAGSAMPPEPEQPFDAYGAEAAQLMTKAGDHFEAVAQQFVDLFWSEIARTAPASAVLADFSADDVARLADNQVAHLRFLLDPATSLDAIAVRAQRVGQVHALIGIGSEVMVQALALHRRILGEHLHGALLPARERYRILLGAESRLQDSMQAELRAMAATLNTWLDHLSEPLPAHGSLWPDARAEEIGRLGALPGILGALVLRLNAEGVFNVEGSAGPASDEIAQALLTPGAEAVVHPASPRGQGTTAQAWRTLEIRTSAHYDRDPRYAFWQADARALGLRSTLSVPILNRQGQPVAMVSLFGAYPNQFESTSMQQFARGLQQRWQQVWLRCSTPATVVPLDVAQDYRHSLFAGGLRIHMQPVIDLRSGALVKVEGLARLERPDGSLLAPAEFLPLLGDAELDRLFRLGLDIVLSQLERWDAEGLHIDTALNLSPGTLLDRDCARWVEQALQRHGVAPRRLTLELLETDTLDASAQEDAIRRLLALGVQLSMDDLGTGHNNLERWARLPFDTIKVDQALLGRVHDNPVLMLSLIRAFVQMGRDIEREVVVEGLEHAATIEAATILGAPFGQGYGLARPMPADQILAWSRQFTLAARGGEVRTALGALAQVWRCVAADGHGGPGHDPVHCPLGPFLARHGSDAAELERWHCDLHAGNPGNRAARQLQTWLARQVIVSGP